MYYKVFLVFLAIFTSQVNAGLLKNVPENSSAIEAIANQIQKTGSYAMQLALAKLAGFVEVVIGSLGYLIANLQQKMNEEVKNSVRFIEAIIEQAQGSGVDPEECVGKSIEDINNIPELVISDVRICVRENAEALRDFQDLSNNKLKAYRVDLEKIVFDLLQQIEVCEDNAFCLGFAGGNAIGAGVSLKNDIGETCSEALAGLVELQKDIAVCETYKIPEFIETVVNITTSVEICLDSEQGK